MRSNATASSAPADVVAGHGASLSRALLARPQAVRQASARGGAGERRVRSNVVDCLLIKGQSTSGAESPPLAGTAAGIGAGAGRHHPEIRVRDGATTCIIAG